MITPVRTPAALKDLLERHGATLTVNAPAPVLGWLLGDDGAEWTWELEFSDKALRTAIQAGVWPGTAVLRAVVRWPALHEDGTLIAKIGPDPCCGLFVLPPRDGNEDPWRGRLWQLAVVAWRGSMSALALVLDPEHELPGATAAARAKFLRRKLTESSALLASWGIELAQTGRRTGPSKVTEWQLKIIHTAGTREHAVSAPPAPPNPEIAALTSGNDAEAAPPLPHQPADLPHLCPPEPE